MNLKTLFLIMGLALIGIVFLLKFLISLTPKMKVFFAFLGVVALLFGGLFGFFKYMSSSQERF